MVVSSERSLRRFSVVVGVCKQTRGIGLKGKLPWHLRADMNYFKQLTRSTRDPLKRNAVIMGRKTWESIPDKFRPLADRLNVVITRNAAAKQELNIPDGVLVADSLENALKLLDAGGDIGEEVERVFVIGGSQIYETALKLDSVCERVHVTEIEQAPVAGEVAAARPAFQCDTFFPPLEG